MKFLGGGCGEKAWIINYFLLTPSVSEVMYHVFYRGQEGRFTSRFQPNLPQQLHAQNQLFNYYITFHL